MDRISKISSYVMYVLLIISLVLTGLMLFGGTTSGDALESPVFTDSILNWGKFLIAGSIITALGFELYNMVVHPTSTKKSLVLAGGLIVVLFFAFIFSDGTPMAIIGYEGSDNVPVMLKITDTGLFTFYFLMVVAVIAILASEIARIMRS